MATYLGDVEKSVCNILYEKKEIKVIMKCGSAKGVSDELYELEWKKKKDKQSQSYIRKDIYRH